MTIALKQDCKVRVRIPEFVAADEMKATSDRGEVKARVWGNYLELGDRKAGEKLEIAYPLPVREEEIAIGNVGFRQYHYRVTWKGDTVVRMTPIGEQVKTAYSDFDKKQVEVFYGEEGPGRLYQREYMLKNVEPKPAPLHLRRRLARFLAAALDDGNKVMHDLTARPLSAGSDHALLDHLLHPFFSAHRTLAQQPRLVGRNVNLPGNMIVSLVLLR